MYMPCTLEVSAQDEEAMTTGVAGRIHLLLMSKTRVVPQESDSYLTRAYRQRELSDSCAAQRLESHPKTSLGPLPSGVVLL